MKAGEREKMERIQECKVKKRMRRELDRERETKNYGTEEGRREVGREEKKKNQLQGLEKKM